jgi:prepilin-type N-terminal cleavage/methylation domain-containing protein
MSNARHRSQAGFSLIELLISTGILLIITSVVTSGLLQMTKSQKTISNRTDMHSGVRSATELLQQEVGQAGRIAVPGTVPITLSAAVIENDSTATLSSVAGLFRYELVTFEGYDQTISNTKPETVQITDINTGTKQITVKHISAKGILTDRFQNKHSAGVVVTPTGGFGTGVVPPAAPIGTFTNGSTGSVLKLYGDINGDGNMVYVEYVCDTVNGALYRNMLPWDAASKPAVTPANILLSNILANPAQTVGGPSLPCFQYQMDLFGNYVLDVAITLTVQTQQIDPITREFQRETKALLNVSPRNVIGAWQSAGINVNRVQPMPENIKNNLLPDSVQP